MASPMKLQIPASTGESSGPVTERQYTTEGDGFSLSFTMPFKCEDVYRELISEKQLGVDHTSITMKITRPGKEEALRSARLQEQLAGAATPAEAADIKAFIDQTHIAYERGCQRTVYFPDGEVVSELIDLIPNRRIQWLQISSTRDVNMIGKGSKLPVVTMRLEPLADGTTVNMTYDFYQILQKDGKVLTGETMAKLLESATAGWSVDMRRRGYTPLEAVEDSGAGTPRSFTPSGPTVLRASARMKQDQEEEKAMKAAMLAKVNSQAS
jgi:hypothetical protein